MNINTNLKAENTYDAIVVGSGLSGGWAAKELTEKGLRVLMPESGENIEHIKDYDTAMKNPWKFTHAGRLTEEQKRTHPVQKRDYPFQEANAKWWVNDLECPYTEDKRFDWYRGFHVGGNPRCGADRVTGSARRTSRIMRRTDMGQTELSVMITWLHGMIMLKNLQGSADQKKTGPCVPMEVFYLQWI